MHSVIFTTTFRMRSLQATKWSSESSRVADTGEFIGFRPTGKTFDAQQIHIYRIADGKIIEHWSSRDDLTQGIQLGLIPIGRPGAEEPREAAIAAAKRENS